MARKRGLGAGAVHADGGREGRWRGREDGEQGRSRGGGGAGGAFLLISPDTSPRPMKPPAGRGKTEGQSSVTHRHVCCPVEDRYIPQGHTRRRGRIRRGARLALQPYPRCFCHPEIDQRPLHQRLTTLSMSAGAKIRQGIDPFPENAPIHQRRATPRPRWRNSSLQPASVSGAWASYSETSQGEGREDDEGSCNWNSNGKSRIMPNHSNRINTVLTGVAMREAEAWHEYGPGRRRTGDDWEETALWMTARADRLKDIILDGLLQIHNSGVNISKAQGKTAGMALRIMRQAGLPSWTPREAGDRLRRVGGTGTA